MTTYLYEASVPVFQRYLARLIGLVDAAQAYAANQSVDDALILNARLAPDMASFEMQVTIAGNFALRTCFPLAGQPIPPYGDFAASFEGLRLRLKRVQALVSSLLPVNFEGAEQRTLESQAGDARVSLVAPVFLAQYALPNFFFHVTTAYAILRSRGVTIGKANFDGFHAYTPRL
jgi:uncharacterized protein